MKYGVTSTSYSSQPEKLEGLFVCSPSQTVQGTVADAS
tara:strand:+ start:722 stop:835 length:114 start_codon:yes stop_codon:yes gene_type:complete